MKGVDQWLRVAEDNDFVYVQLVKADNFYQLPVTVKQIRPIPGGAEALVDVFSDTAHQNLTFQGLTVVMPAGSRIASQLTANQATYLLGFLSVNLKKALLLAQGHEGRNGAVSGRSALEFFAFGVPLNKAVANSNCQEEND
ncbi:MAG TPA: hypothetical protein VG204_09170 [Terriglobia bacterium]|nr:hypothetical protein [Terriglobia bacterium]